MGTTITGVLGAVTVTGGPTIDTDISVFNWTATIASDILDASAFDSTHNCEIPVRGMYDLKGSFDALVYRVATLNLILFDMLTVNCVPASAFTLVTTTGKNWGFTGIIGEVTIDHVKADTTKLRATFESSGAVVVT